MKQKINIIIHDIAVEKIQDLNLFLESCEISLLVTEAVNSELPV